MIRNMALELTLGQMIRNTRDSGSMGNSPASEFIIPPKMAWKDARENGREERESDGLNNMFYLELIMIWC